MREEAELKVEEVLMRLERTEVALVDMTENLEAMKLQKSYFMQMLNDKEREIVALNEILRQNGIKAESQGPPTVRLGKSNQQVQGHQGDGL